jgi:hypothetical protein
MKKSLNKPIIFLTLTIIAAYAGYFAVLHESAFLENIWSELFWLVAATITTTFVLEAILQYDQNAIRRDEDRFAYRTFTATMLEMILEMCDSPSELSDNLMEAAIYGKKQFLKAVTNANEHISLSRVFLGDIYIRHYLDIASGLRDISRNSIRLFASNRKEMVYIYKEMQELASQWDYKDELDSAYQEYTKSLDVTSEERIIREKNIETEMQLVENVIKNTSSRLLDLTRKATNGRGMPSAP